MTKMEAFQLALADLGEARSETLSAHLEQKYGVKIEPKFIPFFRATVRDLENSTRLRQAARIAIPEPET